MKFLRALSLLLMIAGLLPQAAFAQAPSMTFTVEQSSTDGKTVIPRLTWSTTPTAASCAPSGNDTNWTAVANRGAAGTAVLPSISASKTYRLDCSWPGDNQARISWTAPTTNTDGSALADLASFKIVYGTSAGALTQTVTAAKTETAKTITPLAPGTWFFAVRVLNSSGLESDNSNVAQKIVTAAATLSRSLQAVVQIPSPPTSVTVN